MAEIKNYTLNFAGRRPRAAGLTCAARRLAAAEIELRSETDGSRRLRSSGVPHG
jgi:hypothetical protein